MKYAFLRNIRTAIAAFYKDGTRIKLEWVFPTALGLSKNNLDERPSSCLPFENRQLFISMIMKISDEVEMDFLQVLRAFMGPKDKNDRNTLIMKLVQQAKRARNSGGKSSHGRS